MDLLRKASNPVINTLIGIYIAIQLFTPYITVNNETLVSVQAFLKYGKVHWTYNHILFVLAIPVAAYIALVLKKKFKTNFFEWVALLMWVIAIAGLFIFANKTPGSSLDKPASLNFILTFLISIVIILYHIMVLSVNQSVKRATQTDKKMINLKEGKNVLYENVVLLNPLLFYFVHFYFAKPLPFLATDKEFIIGSDQTLTIPFSSIKDIKLHYDEWSTWLFYLLSYIKITCQDGSTYKIVWASHSNLAWWGYANVRHTNKLTKKLYEDIKEVFEKKEKVSDVKWRDFYEKHRKI